MTGSVPNNINPIEFANTAKGLYDIEHNYDYKVTAVNKSLFSQNVKGDFYAYKDMNQDLGQPSIFVAEDEPSSSKTVSFVYNSAGKFGELSVGKTYEFFGDCNYCKYTDAYTKIEIAFSDLEDFWMLEQNQEGTNLYEYTYDENGNPISQKEKRYKGNILEESDIQYVGRFRTETTTTKESYTDINPIISAENNDSNYTLKSKSQIGYDDNLISYEYYDTDGNGTLDNLTNYKYYTDAELGKMEEIDHRDSLHPEEEYILKKWSIDGYNYEYYEFGNAPQKDYLQVTGVSSANELTTWIDRKCNDGGAIPNNTNDIKGNESYYDEIIVAGRNGTGKHEYTIFN